MSTWIREIIYSQSKIKTLKGRIDTPVYRICLVYVCICVPTPSIIWLILFQEQFLLREIIFNTPYSMFLKIVYYLSLNVYILTSTFKTCYFLLSCSCMFRKVFTPKTDLLKTMRLKYYSCYIHWFCHLTPSKILSLFWSYEASITSELKAHVAIFSSTLLALTCCFKWKYREFRKKSTILK